MRKRRTAIALGITATLCAGMTAAVLAEETEGMTEAFTAAEMAGADAEVLETITLTIEGKDPIELRNTAKLPIRSASVELQEDETLIHVVMAADDGKQYEFLDVPYEVMQDPELVMDGAFAFIKYTSLSSGKERSVGQTGELTYSKPAELFAVDDVYIRSEPDDEAEILGVISRGDAIEVLGETATHYLVRTNDVTGYTVRKCISEDEQAAIAAVQAEEAAREQIRLAEEAAAAAAAQAAAQQSGGGSGGGVTEVKRQKFDDCDGSGHGYYEITYSDGSVAYEDY